MAGKIAAVLRAAGCAEAREGLLGNLKAAGFRVRVTSSYTSHPAMVCPVRPARDYGRTSEDVTMGLLSDGALLDSYSRALRQAGYPVHVDAGCVWIEGEPDAGPGS